jgi:biopolymer transport protein ExbD
MAGSFSTAQSSPTRGKKPGKGGRKSLVDPPAMLLVDIALNLLLFFVACASTEPSEGRKQDIPRGESKATADGPAQNLEISITRDKVAVNNEPIVPDDFVPRLRRELSGKTRVEDRIVVVRSSRDTPYGFWIRVTSLIEQNGGIITLQMEEDRVVPVQ